MAPVGEDPEDLGFRWSARRNGEVAVSRGGRVVATLRGAVARAFLARAAVASEREIQQRLARLTGNYRRGNERRSGTRGR